MHDIAPDFYKECPCLTPMPGTSPLRETRTAAVGECWGLCFLDDSCFSFSFSVKIDFFHIILNGQKFIPRKNPTESVQKCTFCNILAGYYKPCKILARQKISCKILPGNTFLAINLRESWKNIFLAKVLLEHALIMHYLAKLCKNLARF